MTVNVKAYFSPNAILMLSHATRTPIMAKMNGAGLLCATFALVSTANAQQFPLLHTPYQNLGLSQACYEALNTTVDCVDQLANLHRYE